MGTTPEIDMDSDVIDPANEDWSEMDDSSVYYAAKAGIAQAKDELKRRESAS